MARGLACDLKIIRQGFRDLEVEERRRMQQLGASEKGVDAHGEQSRRRPW
jgi:hypothetical protein